MRKAGRQEKDASLSPSCIPAVLMPAFLIKLQIGLGGKGVNSSLPKGSGQARRLAQSYSVLTNLSIRTSASSSSARLVA